MNLQEAFDKIWEHAQKKERAHMPGGCRYRTDDGRKCFAGCLIPDELYDPIIEERKFSCGIDRDMDPIPASHQDSVNKVIEIRRALGINNDDASYIAMLQLIHDKNDPEQWNNRLIGFAEKYHLTIPTI